jgi:hypothetical protein
VVLRHQLAILRRGGKRPQYGTVDRALLAAASRLLPSERWSCFAVSPRTLRRWHRTLLRGRQGQRRQGRPPLAPQTRSLIVRLGRENPNWGYIRIQGELLKLGISVSATTVANVLRSSGLRPAPRRIGPSWSEFLRAQAHSLLAASLNPAFTDGHHGDTVEAGTVEDPARRPVEADDNPSPHALSELRLAVQTVPVRNRSAPPCALAATQERPRLVLSHRSQARDGPQQQARPHPGASARERRRPVAPHRPGAATLSRRLRGPSAPSRLDAADQPTAAGASSGLSFFTPQARIAPLTRACNSCNEPARGRC